MKTPRDLLLEQHTAIQSRLDETRRAALAAALQPHAQSITEIQREQPLRPSLFFRVFGGFSLSSCVKQLWTELFWRSRWVGLGLAGAWVVILLLQLQATSESPIPGNPLPVKRAKVKVILHHRPLWTSVLDEAEEATVPVPAPAPKPRSENHADPANPAQAEEA